MGFFDRFAGKSAPSQGNGPALPAADALVSPVAPRLVLAREKLDQKDLPGAMAIYEDLLAVSGDRADVLVTISGDLGATGHIPQIIELVAPRYDARRHGPATGINLLQAYLALGEAEAARHVLDILFSLNKPELEERLLGFSNVVAELVTNGTVEGIPAADGTNAGGPPRQVGLALVTISRPIWSYGFEEIPGILPAKEGKLRRVAFAQLALPGAYPDPEAATVAPEDDLGRLSRAIPLWFSETFHFSPHYASVAGLSVLHAPGGERYPAVLPVEWTVENLRKLAETTEGGLDYIFSGALRREGADLALTLRVWEVRKFKERKQFTARWNASTADAELTKLHESLRVFMEWAPCPEGSGLPYAAPASPSAWLESLGMLLGLFLVDKKLMDRGQLTPVGPAFDALAPQAFSPPASSLAWLSLRARTRALGLEPALADVMLSGHPAVARARDLVRA